MPHGNIAGKIDRYGMGASMGEEVGTNIYSSDGCSCGTDDVKLEGY